MGSLRALWNARGTNTSTLWDSVPFSLGCFLTLRVIYFAGKKTGDSGTVHSQQQGPGSQKELFAQVSAASRGGCRLRLNSVPASGLEL